MSKAAYVTGCALLLSATMALGQSSESDEELTDEVLAEEEVPERTIYERSDQAIANAPEDPANNLENAQQRRDQRDALFDYTIFESSRGSFQSATESLYEAKSIKLTIISNNLFQTISDSFPGADRSGVSSDLDVVTTWELINKGEPTQGQIFLHMEGRWDYGTTPPSDLGDISLGSITRTADPFNSYTPTFLARNFYWQQGSASAGWTYRLGKITPDQTLGTSFHLNPFTTFLPSGSVGSNAPHPDSGLGAVGIKYFDEQRAYVLGLISDANGDRFDFGDISEGDLFKAIEFGYKFWPRTDKAGFSKLTIAHTDGTKDGLPNNVSLGPPGWSIAAKYEQELTSDGRMIGILKYGRTFDKSGLFKHLASGHFVVNDPDVPGLRAIANDALGIGLVWAESHIPNTRAETNLELFYRIPFFHQLDVTASYQSIWNVGRNPDVDQVNVFSIRARTTF